MKIPLTYPKIPGSGECRLEQCIAFEKYDGTNLHWVWERELGWYAFGTRRNRFDLDELGIAEFHREHLGLEAAPEIFQQHWAEPLLQVFAAHGFYDSEEIAVFTEFLGTNSFAGLHQPGEEKQLVLFDVQTAGGLLGPHQFVEEFGGLNIARAVWRGKLNGQFLEDVRHGKYNTPEGVVVKGGSGDSLWMAKVKTHAYMKRLQEKFQDDWSNYWE